jgi:hypothetical protein
MKDKLERKRPAPPASGNRGNQVLTNNASDTKSERFPDSTAIYVASRYRLPSPIATLIARLAWLAGMLS